VEHFRFLRIDVASGKHSGVQRVVGNTDLINLTSKDLSKLPHFAGDCVACCETFGDGKPACWYPGCVDPQTHSTAPGWQLPCSFVFCAPCLAPTSKPTLRLG
jgi:hypothetical protein